MCLTLLDVDKEVVLAAVSENGYALKFSFESFKNDKEIVLAAINTNGYALKFSFESFKNDKEFVLASVNKYGRVLKHISESLKNDKEVVLAAVNQDKSALQYASKSLKNDKYFLYEIDQLRKIKKDDCVYVYLSKNIQTKINKNSDYLLKFQPVNFKPARSYRL